jgi:transcriptional regulator with XRE-family HTH domain
MKFDKKIFAERIRALRVSSNLTLKEVGEALGLKAEAISNMESGIRGTSVESLCKLADFFKVSLEYLVGDSNDSSISHNHNYKLDKSIPNWVKDIIPELTNLTKMNQKAFIALLKGFQTKQDPSTSKTSKSKS